jgi:cell division protein ZapA (FtsZ GTPase activity inhibitor)
MPKGGLRIDILGASFTIAADEDPQYLARLLTHFRSVVDLTKQNTGISDPLKIAIVAGLMVCDEVEKAKKMHTQKEDRDSGKDIKAETAEAERLALDLIARIDEALGDLT